MTATVTNLADFQRVLVLRHGLEVNGRQHKAGDTAIVPRDQAKLLALSGAVDFANAEGAANDTI
jgi:hypothetical protein